jgi:hypothetical protein
MDHFHLVAQIVVAVGVFASEVELAEESLVVGPR